MKKREIRKQAEALLLKMTLDEKIGMVHGAELFATAGVPRLGIPPLRTSDGPMGVRNEFAPDHWETIGHTDDYVSYLPSNSAVAATWNRSLAGKVGSVLGEEARGRGKDVILAPGVNIKRCPLCGRNFEYFSEDPYLTKSLAVPLIRGIQKWDVAACVKHFAANSQETDRLWVDETIDEKTLRKIYFPAFQAAVKEGGVLTVMSAYNRLNGTHCSENGWLLKDVLRKEWGFDGVVISDWGGVHTTKEAAENGLDIEMSVTDNFDEYFFAGPLKQAVEKGQIRESVLDEKVLHILMLMIRLHMLDGRRKAGACNTPQHRKKLLRTAEESIVLLKNDDHILPLDRKRLHRVLVVGRNADIRHSQGGGSAEIKALYEITPLLGLCNALGGNCRVDYVPGYGSSQKKEQSENWQEDSLKDGGGQKAEENGKVSMTLLKEAADLASRKDVYDAVIFVGGLTHSQDSEGLDRADLVLPDGQDAVMKKLLEVRPDTVVVLTGGACVSMEPWIDRAGTLVWSYYNGMEGGKALAEVLLGDVTPSGKLPETFYRRLEDCSAVSVGEFGKEKHVSYSEKDLVGYRYLEEKKIRPLFPFGYGLSYTEFAYRKARAHAGKNGTKLYVTLKNTGDREGSETAEVYTKDTDHENVLILCGFEKVKLQPGEEKTVEITMDVFPKGTVFFIGASVLDIRLKAVI